MHTASRYILVVLGAVLSLHLILSFTHEEYSRVASLSGIQEYWHGSVGIMEDDTMYPTVPAGHIVVPPTANSTHLLSRRANATFVVLARNSDLDSTIRSVREMEERFNNKYQYPYVFLNEEPFTFDFIRRVSVLSKAKMEFGLIPREHWYQPDWIDEEKAAAARQKMVDENVIYGGSLSYRNMCRYNSGFFFRHELLQKYRWYWRIEPDVHFHCNVNYDAFLFMEDNKKVYGWTITMYEFDKTIPTLWGHVKDFAKSHPQYIASNNAMGYLSDTGGDTYNLCHFWSNFEIADMDFWRGEAYQAFFNYLDEQGGFYYERWGDAPVHSIGVGLLANKSQIHFFESMGYEHNPYIHCPLKNDAWEGGMCSCDQKRSFDYDGYSCMKQWDRIQ